MQQTDLFNFENPNLEYMSSVQEYAHNPRQESGLLQFIAKQKELKAKAKAKTSNFLSVNTNRTASAPNTDRDKSPLTVLIKTTAVPQKPPGISSHLAKSTFKTAYEQTQVLSSLRRLSIAKDGNPLEGRLILDRLLKIRPDRPTNTISSPPSVLRKQMASSTRLSSQRSLRRSSNATTTMKYSTSLDRLLKSYNSNSTVSLSANFKVIRIPSSPYRMYFRPSQL